jgi:hypothetical protein
VCVCIDSAVRQKEFRLLKDMTHTHTTSTQQIIVAINKDGKCAQSF